MEVMWTEMEVVVDEGVADYLGELRLVAEQLSRDALIRTVSYRDISTCVFVISVALEPIGVGFGR